MLIRGTKPLKKLLFIVPVLLLSLSACTDVPVSALEEQVEAAELQIQHEQQLTAWEKEQEEIDAGTYTVPEVPLQTLFDAVREAKLIDDEMLDVDDFQMVFGSSGYFTVDSEYRAMGTILEISGENEPGTYSVMLACQGTGQVTIATYANDKQVQKSSLECKLPMSKITKSFEIKDASYSLRIVLDTEPNVRGSYDFKIYW